MPFRVGIVGAGWYGCHIASALGSLGFEVTLFDRQKTLMQEASGNNQFRLHLGFHYARHHGTRLQSRDGFQRFIERYPALSREVKQNIYAVPRGQSLVDFNTYKLIMAASGIDYIEMPEPPALLTGVEGAILTRERVIVLHRARDTFRKLLGGNMELDTEVTSLRNLDDGVELNGRRFDYVVDATWGHLRPLPIEVYYEPTLLLYYECTQEVPAITFVDGPLCSIYPTEDPRIFTLSSVLHTPLGHFAAAGAARDRRAGIDRATVEAKRRAMEAQVSVNVPAFRDLFRFVGMQLAIKTKPVGEYADRSCYVFQDGRIFSVMSGKIDTIFFATERIISMIEAANSSVLTDERPSALRSDILMPMD